MFIGYKTTCDMEFDFTERSETVNGRFAFFYALDLVLRSGRQLGEILNEDLWPLPNIEGKTEVIKEDPDDDIILETAVENNADFIISEDDHLLDLKEYNNVKIITAVEFLIQI